MPIATAADLLELVRHSQLLENKHHGEAALLASQLTDPQAWAKELVRRSWLTGWQINQIGKGKGAELLLGGYDDPGVSDGHVGFQVAIAPRTPQLARAASRLPHGGGLVQPQRTGFGLEPEAQAS